MAVYKEITVTKNDDQKSLAKKLYRYSEDLRFTLSNLDEDNFSREFLNWKHEREEKTRQMQRDSEKMKIRFENTEKEIYSEINQTEEEINMLVARGSVVSTMLSRMSCTIGGELTGDDAFVMETLSCKRLKETSDARLKERIKELTPPDMRRITPVAYRFRKSGQRSMGFIAQELKRPVRCEPHMRVAYGQMGAMWAAAIQENQRRIDRIRKEIERREGRVVF